MSGPVTVGGVRTGVRRQISTGVGRPVTVVEAADTGLVYLAGEDPPPGAPFPPGTIWINTTTGNLFRQD